MIVGYKYCPKCKKRELRLVRLPPTEEGEQLLECCQGNFNGECNYEKQIKRENTDFDDYCGTIVDLSH